MYTTRTTNVKKEKEKHVSFINQFETDTRKLHNVSRITSHCTLYTMHEKYTNGLGISEFMPYYVIAKKRWLRPQYWNQACSSQNSNGTTIPYALFERIRDAGSVIGYFVIFIMNEENFYQSPVSSMLEFVRKYSPRFSDDFGEDVIGLSKDIFIYSPVAGVQQQGMIKTY